MTREEASKMAKAALECSDKTISDVAYILDSLILLRQIQSTGDCNICSNKGDGCLYEPKAGQMVRYNCPFYKADSEEK